MNLKKTVLLQLRLFVRCLLSVVFVVGFLNMHGCSDSNDDQHKKVDVLTVYKTPSCGCCDEWVDHMKESGFTVEVVNQDSVAHVKDYYNIPRYGRSCHTAVSDSGFVFEGHVPAKWVRRFIDEPNDGGRGLVVPAMPLGSPGMEYENQFNPYVVFSLSDSGDLTPFKEINSYEEQF